MARSTPTGSDREAALAWYRAYVGNPQLPAELMAETPSFFPASRPPTDDELVHLRAFPKLQEVRLAETGIGDAGCAALAALTGLEKLDLSFTRITDAGLARLAPLRKLRELALRATKIDGSAFRKLRDWTALEELELWDTRVVDRNLGAIAALPRLRVLDLRGTPVTGAGIKRLAGHKKLEMLELGDSKVTDAQAATFATLPALRYLELDAGVLTDRGVAALAGARKLRVLRLHGCRQLTDDGLAALARLGSLQHLDLGGGRLIRGPGLVHLAKLPLESLDLAASGIGPEAVAPLQQLRGLKSLSAPYCEGLDQASLVALLAAGVPVNDADGLAEAKEAVARGVAAAAAQRSFYLLRFSAEDGTAWIEADVVAADLDSVIAEAKAIAADYEGATMWFEIEVYRDSTRVAAASLLPGKWKRPRLPELVGKIAAKGEKVAVNVPGETPRVLAFGVNG